MRGSIPLTDRLCCFTLLIRCHYVLYLFRCPFKCCRHILHLPSQYKLFVAYLLGSCKTKYGWNRRRLASCESGTSLVRVRNPPGFSLGEDAKNLSFHVWAVK